MENIGHLLDLYRLKKEDIRAKLDSFRAFKSKTKDDIFLELCFCLLTPQSKALAADKAMKQLVQHGFPHNFDIRLSGKILKNSGVRFHKNKSACLSLARDRHMKNDLRFPIGQPIESREWLVDSIKGMGYKEASHFLRNIGYGEDLAILDRHILRNLEGLGVIEESPKSMTRRKYMEIEGRMREFASRLGIGLAELDLLLWSKETGFIFK
ncbi:MAG: N-glycosylase/DNA lyase [Candidatus Aenigmarchaeota archaeon]|nr:N-glycosylase/DNA lyase [Candidatus Aenigmarchaeota archaeon]